MIKEKKNLVKLSHWNIQSIWLRTENIKKYFSNITWSQDQVMLSVFVIVLLRYLPNLNVCHKNNFWTIYYINYTTWVSHNSWLFWANVFVIWGWEMRTCLDLNTDWPWYWVSSVLIGPENGHVILYCSLIGWDVGCW